MTASFNISKTKFSYPYYVLLRTIYIVSDSIDVQSESGLLFAENFTIGIHLFKYKASHLKENIALTCINLLDESTS